MTKVIRVKREKQINNKDIFREFVVDWEHKLITFNVVGVTFIQPSIFRFLYSKYKKQNILPILKLESEINNSFDANAVKVLAALHPNKFIKIGYVPREINKKIREILSSAKTTEAIITRFEYESTTSSLDLPLICITVQFSWIR